MSGQWRTDRCGHRGGHWGGGCEDDVTTAAATVASTGRPQARLWASERPCGPCPLCVGTLITSYVVPLWPPPPPPPDASFFSASMADSMSASMLVISALPLIMANAPNLMGNSVPATIIAPISSGPAYLSFFPRAENDFYHRQYLTVVYYTRAPDPGTSRSAYTGPAVFGCNVPTSSRSKFRERFHESVLRVRVYEYVFWRRAPLGSVGRKKNIYTFYVILVIRLETVQNNKNTKFCSLCTKLNSENYIVGRLNSVMYMYFPPWYKIYE